jgi:hypothetical protein
MTYFHHVAWYLHTFSHLIVSSLIGNYSRRIFSSSARSFPLCVHAYCMGCCVSCRLQLHHRMKVTFVLARFRFLVFQYLFFCVQMFIQMKPKKNQLRVKPIAMKWLKILVTEITGSCGSKLFAVWFWKAVVVNNFLVRRINISLCWRHKFMLEQRFPKWGAAPWGGRMWFAWKAILNKIWRNMSCHVVC